MSNSSNSARRVICHDRIIVAMLTALLGCIWLFVAVAVNDARHRSNVRIQQEFEARTAIVAEQAILAMKVVDSTLTFLVNDLADDRTPGRLRDFVSANAGRVDALTQLSLVDARGYVSETNAGIVTPPIDLSDREHVRVHLDRVHDGLFVSRPVQGRVSGRWSIQMTRAIKGAGGQVDGVLVASVDPNYFERYWTSINPAKTYRLDLIGTDGILRASSDDTLTRLAKLEGRTDIAALASMQKRGTVGDTKLEGLSGRIEYYERLDALPLVVAVSAEKATYLSEFNKLKSHYLMLGIVASLLLAVFAVSIIGRSHEVEAQRKSAEQAQLRLRDAIDAIPEGFALFDAEDRLVICNHAYARIYARSDNLIRTGVTFEEIIREGAARGQYDTGGRSVDDWVAERLAMHRSPSGRFEQQIDGGRWVQIEERRTHDGGIAGIRSDITERKNRELALLQQTALLNSIFENMGEGLAVIGADGTIVTCNDHFRDVFGIPGSIELDGTDVLETLGIFGQSGHLLANPDRGDAAWAMSRSIAEPGKSMRWYGPIDTVVELCASRLPEGGSIVIAVDVSRRIADEKRLQLSEAQKSAIVAAAFDGVMLINEAGRILEYNAAAEKMFGWNPREAKNLTLRALVDLPENLAAATTAMVGRLTEGAARDSRDRVFPVELAMNEIKTERGIHYSVYVRDISERKRHASEMRTAREAAEAANTAKSQFLAMISHELRTPMNGIIGLTQLLRDGHLTETQDRFARGIDESAARLLRLVNEILEFSRIEAGKMAFSIAPFKLDALLATAVETAQILLREKPVVVTAEIDPSIAPVVLGDATRIYQVIQNFVGNSAKFTEAGSIILRLHSISQSTVSQRIRLEVQDTGAGIPQAVQPHIFTPFHQGEADIAHKFGGSGLGLAICRNLIDLMQGSIGFSSVAGEGSLFWFELDLTPTAACAVRLESAEDEPACSATPLRVLVAEDTPTNQLVIATMLERLGHSAQIVSDGIEALREAERGDFDAVLLDIQMPNMDGMECARRIRRLYGAKSTLPLIALTAQITSEARARMTSAGIDHVLEKPISRKRLAAVLNEIALAIAAGEDAGVSSGGDPALPAGAASLGFDSSKLAEIRAATGDDGFAAMLDTFAADCAQSLADVARAMSTGDAAHIRKIAHRMHGLLAQFGLTAAATAAEEVECAPDDETCRARVAQLTLEIGAPADLRTRLAAVR